MAHSASPRRAPGPRPLPGLGNMLAMNRLGIIGFAEHTWRTHGDISRFQFGPMHAHLLVRPEHVQHILVTHRDNYLKGASHDKLRLWLGRAILTSEGDHWKRQRALMQPTYTPRHINQFADIMVAEAQRTAQRWLAAAAHAPATPLNLNHELMRLTVSIISRAMFNEDISASAVQVETALQTILSQSVQRMTAPVDLPLWVPTTANRQYQWAVRTLDTFIFDIIRRRRAQATGDDLLWLLIQARDQDTGAVMDDRQLRDEVLVTFFAGHETSAQLLTWCFYLLAQNPTAEARLHAELASVLGGRSPTPADLPALPWVRMVLDETLRLYPPVAMFPRDVVAADVIDGYAIPANSMVFLGPYMTHRHPEFWERPLEFFPEHFTPERVAARPRYAYYPFSAGPRTCIGNHFALMETSLALAELAQRVRLRVVPEQMLQPEFVGTLRPPGARLLVEVRAR